MKGIHTFLVEIHVDGNVYEQKVFEVVGKRSKGIAESHLASILDQHYDAWHFVEPEGGNES
ncbi:hypothetical protein EG878_14705 [Enterococcus faecalis]|nr:hypothetical protein EG878_14705 [Enterococcus faecalis]